MFGKTRGSAMLIISNKCDDHVKNVEYVSWVTSVHV